MRVVGSFGCAECANETNTHPHSSSFACVCELWETVKIRLRPKFETLWITLLFKGGPLLSSYVFLSYLLSFPLDTYAICSRHFGLIRPLTMTFLREYQLGTMSRCARNFPQIEMARDSSSSRKYIILNIVFHPASPVVLSVMIRTFATLSLNPPPLFTSCSSTLPLFLTHVSLRPPPRILPPLPSYSVTLISCLNAK